MIKFSYAKENLIEYVCPHCGEACVFLVYAPQQHCYECFEPIPFLNKLAKFRDVRILYHTTCIEPMPFSQG
jgi:hypothetical protein